MSILPLHQLQVNNVSEVYTFFPDNQKSLNEYVEKAKNEALYCLEEITNIPRERRSFDNTIYALDAVETLLYSKRRAVEAVAKTHPFGELRKQANDQKDTLIKFTLDNFYTKKIYDIYHETINIITTNDIKLSQQKSEFLSWKMLSLKREGLHLSADVYAKAQALKNELNQLESQFLQNIDQDTSFILVEVEALEGVPPHLIETLTREETKFKVTCQYPHFFPVMRYCQNEDTRKRLHHAFENRAPANTLILGEILCKREEFAKLIGFQSFAHLDIADQLAKSPEMVEKFIHSLREGISGKYNDEISRLIDNLPSGVTLNERGEIKAWDLMYIQESYKKKFAVDELELQQYFPFEKTLEKIIKMFEEMFSLKIERVDTNQEIMWGNKGYILKVSDLHTNLHGHIIIDPFPRAGKFPHGYCFDVLSPCQLPNGKVNPAIVLLMVNFTPPASNRDSLLKHDELVIFFHELGHAFHQLLGNAEMPSRSGYHVQSDILEWPSRLVELLMWEKECLQQLGEHYQSGEKIPDTILDPKIASKNLFSGIIFSKFFASSLFSLKVYSGDVKDPKGLREEIEKDFLKGMVGDANSHKENSFLHLAEHFYRSKFYAYFWADVYAFDTFQSFGQSVKSQKPWLKFKEHVLSKGGGMNPEAAARVLLGRDPSVEAYINKLSNR